MATLKKHVDELGTSFDIGVFADTDGGYPSLASGRILLAQLPASVLASVDEDDMVSDSAILVPTQQSVVAYVAAELAASSPVISVNGEVGVVVIDAGDVGSTATGDVAATTVQTAIAELASEKARQDITLTAGAGLTGGGDLSAARTFDIVAADATITVATGDIKVGTVPAPQISFDNTISGLAATDVKVALDELTSEKAEATADMIAGAGLTGGGDLSANRTFDVIANADASIVVNANDIQVGVLASDAQHGTRGGGNQHADVIAGGASGFMTGADKTKLDGVETGATADQIASEVVSTATGDVSATDVQAAIAELAGEKARKDNVLELDNTALFVPAGDYHPATKKYVDDLANGARSWREVILHCDQLVDGATGTGGIRQAALFSLSAQPSALESITIDDGTTPVTFTEGTDWTLGGSLAATTTAITAAIDGHASFSAVEVTSLAGHFDTPGSHVSQIIVFSLGADEATVYRLHGDLSNCRAIDFDSYDYSDNRSTDEVLGASYALGQEFGFGRLYANVQTAETHVCAYDDAIKTWNDNSEQWNSTGGGGLLTAGAGIANNANVFDIEAGDNSVTIGTDDIAVNAGDGLTVGSDLTVQAEDASILVGASGVKVGKGNGIDSATAAVTVLPEDASILVGASGVKVGKGNGIDSATAAVTVLPEDASILVGASGVKVGKGNGIDSATAAVTVLPEDASILVGASGVKVGKGNGIDAATAAVTVKASDASLLVAAGGVSVELHDSSLALDTGGLRAGDLRTLEENLDTNALTGTDITPDFAYQHSLYLEPTSGDYVIDATTNDWAFIAPTNPKQGHVVEMVMTGGDVAMVNATMFANAQYTVWRGLYDSSRDNRIKITCIKASGTAQYGVEIFVD